MASDVRSPRIHHFQHVPFEGLGNMEAVFKGWGSPMSATHWYRGDQSPALHDYDWLVVMGGPMNIHDHDDHPWLIEEKQAIADAINAGKVVLGICLGAQLIAHALGAQVRRNAHKEIGWFPIQRQPGADGTLLDGVLPEQLTVFHWHGDTFDLPAGARLLASSPACRNQAFCVGDRVFGFQFHLETTPESARLILEHSMNDLEESQWVQNPKDLLGNEALCARINGVMRDFLQKLVNPNDPRLTS